MACLSVTMGLRRMDEPIIGKITIKARTRESIKALLDFIKDNRHIEVVTATFSSKSWTSKVKGEKGEGSSEDYEVMGGD